MNGGQGETYEPLKGQRSVVQLEDACFPECLRVIPQPPKQLYVVGNMDALRPGLAIVGARKATPYGRSCAERFAQLAAKRGVVIVSGGARGCDAAAHEGALKQDGQTVVFLGGGANQLYPAEHKRLFQLVIDAGGAVVSEYAWDAPPLPYQFRARNRLIAGMSLATLIVEAGLPSGTFSTADEALAAGREVLAVPGAITSAQSKGSNRLIHQGATPIVDDESFNDALFGLFGCLKQEEFTAEAQKGEAGVCNFDDTSEYKTAALFSALRAAPMGMEELYEFAVGLCGAQVARPWLMEHLARGEQRGMFERYPDGRWGPVAK